MNHNYEADRIRSMTEVHKVQTVSVSLTVLIRKPLNVLVIVAKVSSLLRKLTSQLVDIGHSA